MSESKVIWQHCNECLRETKHSVLYEKKKRDTWSEGNHEIAWITTTSVLECCGCESVALQKTVYCTEDECEESITFPPRISRQRAKWHYSLPSEYQRLLVEVYAALHADSRMLTLMGARALIDGIDSPPYAATGMAGSAGRSRPLRAASMTVPR